MKPAVFVDRDGTLIVDRGYLDRLDHMELLPGAVEALRLVREAGFAVVVVTNQAGVARGRFEEAFVPEAHQHLQGLLSAGGASVDAYYYCPHHPEGVVDEYRRVCECRKPSPGMVQRAVREMDLDVDRSYVIGDTWLDVGLAVRSGARGILVRTGYGASVEGTPPEGLSAETVVDTVLDAAEYIVGQARQAPAGR